MSGSSSNYGSLANTSSTAGTSSVPTWSWEYQPSATTGVTQTEQTGGAESKPSWMSGVWDAGWWGKNASTGETMSNADLTAQNNTSLLNSVLSSGSGGTSDQTSNAIDNYYTYAKEGGWLDDDAWSALSTEDKHKYNKGRSQNYKDSGKGWNWNDTTSQ